MDYLIRDANQNDMKSVLGLIKELALFEREPNEVIITENQLMKDGFSKNPKFKCFVAEVKSEVIGIALLYPRYSTWKGQAMHLEDLIVTKKHRGKGIGFALFSKFIKYSHDLKVKRVQQNQKFFPISVKLKVTKIELYLILIFWSLNLVVCV